MERDEAEQNSSKRPRHTHQPPSFIKVSDVEFVNPTEVPTERLIQGVIGPEGRNALHDKLIECNYDAYDDNYSVTLFRNTPVFAEKIHYHRKWDARVFGGPLTNNPKDFSNVNIQPCEAAFNKDDIWGIVDNVARDLRDGKWTIVACPTGEDSKAILYALIPIEANKPRSQALIEAAESYLKYKRIITRCEARNLDT